jgi:DNA-binding MarR family transcriptional regulator
MQLVFVMILSMDSKPLPTHALDTWRLFITAHARLVAQIEARLDAANQIPLHWYDVLIELFEAHDKRLRMHDLAERVVLSRSGLTRLVDRLEREGLLRREVDSADRRGFYVVLTEAGEHAMRAAWPVYAEGIADTFGKHLSEEEAATLMRVFAAILDTAKDAPVPPGSNPGAE